MEIINLTSHSVNIVADNNVIEIKPSGIEARCVENAIHVDTINDNIYVYETQYGEVTNLPEPKENTIYIVSTLVRLASPERHDLYSPAKPVRNEAGQVIGCMGLNH